MFITLVLKTQMATIAYSVLKRLAVHHETRKHPALQDAEKYIANPTETHVLNLVKAKDLCTFVFSVVCLTQETNKADNTRLRSLIEGILEHRPFTTAEIIIIVDAISDSYGDICKIFVDYQIKNYDKIEQAGQLITPYQIYVQAAYRLCHKNENLPIHAYFNSIITDPLDRQALLKTFIRGQGGFQDRIVLMYLADIFDNNAACLDQLFSAMTKHNSYLLFNELVCNYKSQLKDAIGGHLLDHHIHKATFIRAIASLTCGTNNDQHTRTCAISVLDAAEEGNTSALLEWHSMLFKDTEIPLPHKLIFISGIKTPAVVAWFHQHTS